MILKDDFFVIFTLEEVLQAVATVDGEEFPGVMPSPVVPTDERPLTSFGAEALEITTELETLLRNALKIRCLRTPMNVSIYALEMLLLCPDM